MRDTSLKFQLLEKHHPQKRKILYLISKIRENKTSSFPEEFYGSVCQTPSGGPPKSRQYAFPYPCLFKQNPLVAPSMNQ